MTDNSESIPANNPSLAQAGPGSHSNLEAHHANYTRTSRELSVRNKAALFDALAAAGITVVVVTFDGGSDEGQIESIEAKHADEALEFPDQQIELQHAVMDATRQTRINALAHSFPEAITDLVYVYLGQVQEGWEDGEGAYGDFTFDVENRTITLDFNERFIDSENSTYEF